jgi:putative heme-binding domain-containing protein
MSARPFSRALALLLGLHLGLACAAGDGPTRAEWLGGGFPNATRQFFRRDIIAPPALLKAVAHVASSGDVLIQLNGSELRSTNRLAEFDLTPLLQPGTNRLTLAVTGTNKAPHVAFRVELNRGLAGREWIVSDTNWLAGTDGKNWSPAKPFKPAAGDAEPFPPSAAFDAYNGWRLASGAGAATPPESIQTLPGFRVELIRSAQPEEGSWIAMTFDENKNLILAREKRGLIRLQLENFQTVTQVELIDDTLEEVRGLVHLGRRLYAHANRGKELVMLLDRNGDGRHEYRRTILRTEGGFGHGRNKMLIGSDGNLYVAFGNDVELPPELVANAPLRRAVAERLIPCEWDSAMFGGRANATGGFILRMDPRGTVFELFAGGFRNPMGIASNLAGELFTFDADTEGDVGTPWYMPTRILQVVSGGDYGWRRGTGRLPAHYPDTLPSALDVGLASPTATAFGSTLQFPMRYQSTLFACDWAYGRILAIHFDNVNGSYRGTPEVFVSGRPLNVTDLVVGPDERLWFITGGRGTRSGLYRISWVGDPSAISAGFDAASKREREWTELRLKRKYFEQDHTRTNFNRSWEGVRSSERPLLESNLRTNRFFRHSQRLVLENWLEHANPDRVERFLETPAATPNPDRLLALARASVDVPLHYIVTHLLKTPLSSDLTMATTVTRTMALAFIRKGGPDEDLRRSCLAWAEAAYPHPAWQVNHDLIELLVYLRSTKVIPLTLPLLEKAERSEDLLQYTFYLRLVRDGWTPSARRAVFEALRRAASMPGARNYHRAVKKVREEFVAALTPGERSELAEFFADASPPVEIPSAPARFVKNWEAAHFAGELATPLTGRSHAGGREALVQARCVSCHRVSSDPGLTGGLVGPDLTGVGGRFGPHDLLDHILNPSKVVAENYQSTVFTLRDGEEITGVLEGENAEVLFVREHPLSEKTTRVDKAQIMGQKASPVSTMPAGLLNTLGKAQVLDLLAYLHSGGDPNHPVFVRPAQSADSTMAQEKQIR